MGAPELIVPGTASGGPPVGGSGAAGTLPIWTASTTLGDSAVTQVAGSIFSLTGLVGGTGYSGSLSGTPVALTGGTGTGATASIVVASGAVIWVGLLAPGSGYTAGDVLTIPGGVGGTITVLAVVPKNDASGHLTAQRIGAGTTQPVAGIDSRFGGAISGWQRTNSAVSAGAQIRTFGSGPVGLRVGDYAPEDYTASGTNVNFYRLYATAFVQNSNSGNPSPTAVVGNAAPTVSSGASAGVASGGIFVAQRFFDADTNTNYSITGVAGAAQILSVGTAPFNSYTTNILRGVQGSILIATPGTTNVARTFDAGIAFGAGANTHTLTEVVQYNSTFIVAAGGAVTIGTFYGLRLGVTAVAGATFTNKYPHAQEDTDGRNYFRSPTFFGSAVGTARSATNPSVEVEAVGGVSNGDVRLRSASAVFDAGNSSTNGVRFFARTTGDLPSTTTQNWYEEGTYTPTGSGWQGTLAGSWTRVGRKVFVTINLTGTPNGNAAGSTLTLPSGLAPARGGAGLRVKTASGTALGNGVCSVDPVSGLIQISTAITVDNDAKTIQAEYEV